MGGGADKKGKGRRLPGLLRGLRRPVRKERAGKKGPLTLPWARGIVFPGPNVFSQIRQKTCPFFVDNLGSFQYDRNAAAAPIKSV